jgi:hypothetical protein
VNVFSEPLVVRLNSGVIIEVPENARTLLLPGRNGKPAGMGMGLPSPSPVLIALSVFSF